MAIRIWAVWLLAWCTARAGIPDRPFLQDVSVQFGNRGELANAVFSKLCVDQNGVAYVLTDRGVARVFGDELVLDHSFRPLTGKPVRDIALGPSGELYYLLDDRWLSNGDSAKPLGHLPPGVFEHLAVEQAEQVLLSGREGLALSSTNGLRPIANSEGEAGATLFSSPSGQFFLKGGQVGRMDPSGKIAFLVEGSATTLAARGSELVIGTHDGFYSVDARTGETRQPLEKRLPNPDIVQIVPAPEGTWFGAARGAFFLRDKAYLPHDKLKPELPDGPNGIRYYASRRWLKDDAVIDLALDPDGNVWVLTRTGLSKIEFRTMTLAEKADYFDRKIRLQHIRYGLSAERRLPRAGDIASSEMIDTDNDGGWSSYYLVSQACRYAVTRRPQARANAWEVFAALERLQTINPLPGFSARTFERAGYKVSDPDRWREVPGGDWEWKGHTSSDEIASQTFAHAVMWECVAENDAERRRIAANYTRMVDHIIAHNWYLADVDGKPTLWGRWNPEYVNWYPPSIFDRRLNSAEIIASLQLAYRMSGNELYRRKAEELFEQHGYLTNIVSSMHRLKPTPGFVHMGNEMGDEWNHSDDELAFVTYWVLCRFAFTESLAARYLNAVREHWEMERAEQYPMWNFIYAGCGAAEDCAPAGAVWTLRGFPLDTITWRIENSSRHDLTPLPPNFMRRELKELLPPGERQITRCNTQPFILDGGDGGHTEFPGDEYLLGYWLGRYLNLID